MAADFIEQDGNIYLRLTGSTTQVSFAATSTAANTYTMSFAGLQVKNTGNLIHFFNNSNETIVYDNVTIGAFQNVRLNGTGATFVNVDATVFDAAPGLFGVDGTGSFDVRGRHYEVTWTNAFPNADYTPTITIDPSGLSAAVQNYTSVNPTLYAISDITNIGFKVQFRNTVNTPDSFTFIRSWSAGANLPFSVSKYGGINNPSYVGINQVITSDGSGTRLFPVTGVNQSNTQYTTTNTSNFLCLGNTVL